MTTPLIELALQRALSAYAGKVDDGGQPYIMHPLRVMATLDDLVSQCVALLHDVIEDGGVTADDLRADGFPEAVVSAVVVLTREEGEPYESYIKRVRSHPLARKVKLKDIEDNLNVLRLGSLSDYHLKRIRKYHSAWKLLDSPEPA